MAQYTKHNSNYIKTNIHQKLKDGSTIFEQDWVTIGSQLHFGPGKIPYYTNGNFIFTTSPIPYYQKKYKNGVAVGLWTYDDVKDATNTVNKINNDEYTEDIRTYAYYGSCVELVRSSIEHIINNFPGNITVSNNQIEVLKDVEEFSFGEETTDKEYVVLDGYYILNNPFDINLSQKDVRITQYDNDLHYLSYSWGKYDISTDNGKTFESIKSYGIVTRSMYEKVETCNETIKTKRSSISLSLGESEILTVVKNLKLPEGEYFMQITDGATHNEIQFTINQVSQQIKYNENKNVILIFNDNSEQVIYQGTNNTISITFYQKTIKENTYKYYQMFDDEEYANKYEELGWIRSTCVMNNWLPDTAFLNRCDKYQRNVLYSEISDIGYNQPVYTVTINNDVVIEGYIYDGEIVPLVKTKDKEIIIQPKEEIIENYFNNLQGFEKQLLTRKTKPLYSNMFVTPIEYNLGYLYYKRTYTWPSKGYCIDITSTTYIDFLNKLSSMAEIYDELWTDNLWRRMTHEAIKNYDWTYTREFDDGEEQDNIDGGERMHKVLNIIGRVFDDVKRNIDLIKRNNKTTYNSDRNMPNALLSDKLELMGWDVYSTISTYTDNEKYIDENGNEQTLEREYPSSEVKIDDDFLEKYNIKWYGTKNNNELTFTDVDVNFMRKLLLSSKYILKTKGTRAAIDMVMAMFGYGLTGEDYEIIETYRKVKPKMYDYSESAEAEVFGDKIVRLNAYKENEHIYTNDEVSGIPVGSFKVQTNIDDICNFTTYLIPYYDQRKIYDGNFTFQSKGGWFYNGEDRWIPNEQYYCGDRVFYDGSIWCCIVDNKEDEFNANYFEKVKIEEWIPNKQYYCGDRVFHNDSIWRCTEDNTGQVVFSEEYFEKEKEKENQFKWTETLSYLHVVSTIKDLLNVNPNSVTNGNIYYVANVNDYIDYTEESTLKSNFFVLNNDFAPDIFSSWKNIDLNDTNDENADRAKYLDSIILNTLGNNPHVGFGGYDKGETYFEYMKKPFKYAIERNFFSYEDKEEANEIEFEIDEKDTEANNSSDKIKIFADQNDMNEDEDIIEDYRELTKIQYINIYENSVSLTEEEYNELDEEEKPKYRKCIEYNRDAVREAKKNIYYLNSKVVYFTNKINNEHYKKYFKNVIMKYLMQVVPSTTILILQGFE